MIEFMTDHNTSPKNSHRAQLCKYGKHQQLNNSSFCQHLHQFQCIFLLQFIIFPTRSQPVIKLITEPLWRYTFLVVGRYMSFAREAGNLQLQNLRILLTKLI